MYKKKIEFFLSDSIKTKLLYNPIYISKKENIISNKTNKKRYLISDEIMVDRKKIFRVKDIPNGVQYIYISNSEKILLNSTSSFLINENFKIMIQLDPHSSYNLENYFSTKNSNESAAKRDIEDFSKLGKELDLLIHKVSNLQNTNTKEMSQVVYNKNIKPFYYSNNEIIMTKIMHERYEELIESSKKDNSIIYIGDAFTKFNLDSHFNVIDFSYSDMFLMQKLLTENIFSSNIKFIFIESGWLGKDNSWRKILSSNSNELRILRDIANSSGLKIVFMNKEDPYHFNAFINVAKIADFIITTDESCVSKYKKVSNAPIIVQSYFIDNIKYNPFYKKNINKNIFFAGAYYEKFKERTAFFESACPALKVDIFDRNINNATINKMPMKLEKYVIGGALSQEELIDRSLEYKFALNLNSIIDEETMVARRVFENIALGMPQVSNYSKAISKLDEYEIIMDENDDISKICNAIEKYEYNTAKLQKNALEILRKLSTYKLVETINEYKVANITLPHDLCFEIQVDTESELLSNILNVSKFKSKTNIVFNFLISEKIEFSNEELINKIIYNSSIYINGKVKELPTIRLEKNVDIPINMVEDIYIASKSQHLLDKNIEFIINDTIIYMKRSNIDKKEKIDLDYNIKAFEVIIPIVTNGYPSYSNIYQNGFIYSRVKDYSNNNIFAPCFKIKEEFNNYEFEDTNCFEVSVELVIEILKIIDSKHIEIHFLEERMKKIIHNLEKQFVIFVHGYEAQNIQKRRPFLVEEKDIEMDKLRTFNKQKVFSEVITYKNVTLNFVSNWQVDVFNEDINIMNLPFTYSVNPNKIDMEKFKFKEKSFSKLKVLSIRPFASNVYANDITIGAILKLSEKDYFDNIEFTICGAGVLYGKQVKELYSKKFPNVKFINKFFTHDEIKHLHDENNIFVCPSRTDTQGVSRCEAMASGLVTIGTKVDGVPEFNTEDTGYLMEKNSIEELSNLIESIYWDRRVLPEISYSANKFINEKCNYKIGNTKYSTNKFKSNYNVFEYNGTKSYSLKIKNYNPKNPIFVSKDCAFSIYCFDDSLDFIKFNKDNYAEFADVQNKRVFHIPQNTNVYFNEGANISIIPSIEKFDEAKFLDIYLKGEYLVFSNGKIFNKEYNENKIMDTLEYSKGYYFSKTFKNNVHVTSNNEKLAEIVSLYSKKISTSTPCYALVNEKNNIVSIIISYELLERNELDIFASTTEIIATNKIMQQAKMINIYEERNA